jgi:hypothetical protein
MRQLLTLVLAAASFTPFYAVAHHLLAPASTSKTELHAEVTGRSNAFLFAATATSSPFHQVDFNWQYAPNAPNCGSKPEDCIAGFTLTNTTTGEVIATPSSLGPTALSYAYQWPGGVPYGNFTFSLVANGYDGSGKPLISEPATVTVSVALTTLSTPSLLLGKPGR